MTEKHCDTCNIIKPLEMYRKYTEPYNSYSKICKSV